MREPYKCWFTGEDEGDAVEVVSSGFASAAEQFARETDEDGADGNYAPVSVRDKHGEVNEFNVYTRVEFTYEAKPARKRP